MRAGRVAVSCHALPDGRLDWVWSSSHLAWSTAVAAELAVAVWPTAEVIAGRTPGVVHVVVAAGRGVPRDGVAKLAKIAAAVSPDRQVKGT